jgi:hypothetical protein
MSGKNNLKNLEVLKGRQKVNKRKNLKVLTTVPKSSEKNYFK